MLKNRESQIIYVTEFSSRRAERKEKSVDVDQQHPGFAIKFVTLIIVCLGSIKADFLGEQEAVILESLQILCELSANTFRSPTILVGRWKRDLRMTSRYLMHKQVLCDVSLQVSNDRGKGCSDARL